MKTAGSLEFPTPDQARDTRAETLPDASTGHRTEISLDTSGRVAQRCKRHGESAEDYLLHRYQKIFSDNAATPDSAVDWQIHPPRPCLLPRSNPHLQARPQTAIATTCTVRPCASIRVRKTTHRSRRMK